MLVRSRHSFGMKAAQRRSNGLIAALISVVIIATITAVGTQLSATFGAVGTALSGANN